jgi:hypothetical protein
MICFVSVLLTLGDERNGSQERQRKWNRTENTQQKTQNSTMTETI